MDLGNIPEIIFAFNHFNFYRSELNELKSSYHIRSELVLAALMLSGRGRVGRRDSLSAMVSMPASHCRRAYANFEI